MLKVCVFLSHTFYSISLPRLCPVLLRAKGNVHKFILGEVPGHFLKFSYLWFGVWVTVVEW